MKGGKKMYNNYGYGATPGYGTTPGYGAGYGYETACCPTYGYTCGNSYGLILVLFILLVIIGCSCYGFNK